MLELETRLRALGAEATARVPRPRLVVLTGVLLVVAQAGFRAWALYPSFFYRDDYKLLLDATRSPLDVGYLLAPYNAHLMPGSRLLFWLVAHAGELDWGLAATLTLLLQLAAGLSALWMLVVLFGARPAVLVPLALYLTTVLNLPAMMWWTASMSQVPLQPAFFLAVGCWVCYLRSPSPLLLLATTAAVVLGLLFFVKALLVVPVLAFLAVAYFASGSPASRVVTVVRRYGGALLVGGVVSLAYTGYYLTHAGGPLSTSRDGGVLSVARTMIGTAFVTGVTGGPWHWSHTTLPTVYADPPAWAVVLAWVVVLLVVGYGVATRTRTGRAWLLLVGYLVGLVVLLAQSRAPVYGATVGLDYRYLTDGACAVLLCTALAFLPLRGAPESSARRARPLVVHRWPVIARPPRTALLVALVLVCGSGVVSSVRYVHGWHTGNASAGYFANLEQGLARAGTVDLVNEPLPYAVLPGIFRPDNQLRRVVLLMSDLTSFPAQSSQLQVVSEHGGVRQALIAPGLVAADGPRPGCGWLVGRHGRTIPLPGRAFDYPWWLRVGYLSSAGSPVTVSAGGRQVTSRVEKGVHSLYVKIDGTFDHVHIDGLTGDARVCVDRVEVGRPVPGGG